VSKRSNRPKPRRVTEPQDLPPGIVPDPELPEAEVPEHPESDAAPDLPTPHSPLPTAPADMPDPELPDAKEPEPPIADADADSDLPTDHSPLPTMVIEVPLSAEIPSLTGGLHVTTRVEVSHLTAEQRTALWRLHKGLNDSHAQLANGRHVDHTADAVRWVLEQLVESG